jgi:hypothetical protein
LQEGVIMQESGVNFERQVRRELPGILADLLDRPVEQFRHEPVDAGREIDAVIADEQGARWLIEAKNSSAPGVVARAAEQLAVYAATVPDGIKVLVVPYMTPAGIAAAADRGVNWIDLSGNARIRDQGLYISVQGHPNAFTSPGRPSSPFAPKSSRVARVLLENPARWWRQKDLVPITSLDDGRISRLVRRLDDEKLLVRREDEFRPADPDLLLDAWADDYRFDRHERVLGHASGNGIELAREISSRFAELSVDHALTGLPAAWLVDPFARFRLVSIYVDGDPHDAANDLELRRNERGANVQLLRPDDAGVFFGRRALDGVPVVSPVQTYLDLRHLPERAAEAADHLRDRGLLWDA